ncbi:hypothetical protein F2Q68_00002623 [Brassica cretica]|nr:hypothetical protein F2Q68_00002623 [Brassica cretica]
MTGGYRRVFQKPIDFEWELLTYTDSNKPLAETDLDRITMEKPADKVGSAEETESDSNQPESCETDLKDSEQTQLALKMALTLPSSCYATMAIRELLKTSTSVSCISQDTKLVIYTLGRSHLLVIFAGCV